MATKEKSPPASGGSSLIGGGWFQPGLYKRTQGRYVRQITFAALALIVLLCAWRFEAWWSDGGSTTTAYIGAGVMAVLGLWISFRLVNYPKFADFLIAVEAEMGKVSWPTRKELFRGSVVVLVTIVFLGFVLIGFDLFWTWVLGALDWLIGRITGG